MPVIEHEVHPSVRIGPDHRYGCWNRQPFADWYYAPDRIYRPDGSFGERQVFVPHTLSTECRYDMSLTDWKCTDCAHRGLGETYDRMIREQGK